MSKQEFPWRALLLIAALYVVVAFIRITAQSDLHQGDQPKQADYILDIICRGNWLVQHHVDGSVLSKPPLYNWLAAPVVMLFGTTEWALKSPSLLAGFAAILMLFDMAWRRIGKNAALYGCLFLLLTSMYVKQMYYARTDMLLTCFIVMQFWAVVRWEESRSDETPSLKSGWLWLLWIAAGLGNLTKGPIALFVPHLALAAWWSLEGRLKDSYKRLGVWWGLPLSLLILFAWFVPACLSEHEVFDKQFQKEIVERFDSNAEKSFENRGVFYYIAPLFSRTLPWSLLTLAMFFVIPWRKKSTESATQETQHESSGLRLLALWVITTVLMFSVIPSKRIDRIFPAIPPFCLLAGFGLDLLLRKTVSEIYARWSLVLLRMMAWLTLAIILTFGLLVIAANFGIGPMANEKLLLKANTSVDWLIAIRSQRTFIFIAGAIVTVAGLISMWGLFKQRATVLVGSVVVAFVLITAMYQNYFGEWLKGGVGRDAEALTTFMSKQPQQGKRIYFMAGLAHPIRYNLRNFDKELHVADALETLPTLPGGFYLIGTLSRDGVNERKPGTLEAGGAWGAGGKEAVRPGGELVFSAGNSPLSAQRVCVIYFK